MISATNLTKIYGSGEAATRALVGVSLEVVPGEFIAIIGKSGAGKSTLLHILGLLDTPTEGEVLLDSTQVAKLTQKQKTSFRLERLGYIFQDYALLPELTAEENVLLPLMMLGYSNSAARERAQETLAQFGLGKRFDHVPAALSGGEQQRVAIARAIAHKPKILFADEPTANLDTANAQVILDELKALNAEGQTIVMITHEDEYSKQAHRIIELGDGALISDTKI